MIYLRKTAITFPTPLCNQKLRDDEMRELSSASTEVDTDFVSNARSLIQQFNTLLNQQANEIKQRQDTIKQVRFVLLPVQ